MYILALETTGPKASVAIIDQEGNISEISGEELLSHLKSVMPMTKKLLESLGLSMRDITAVAASRGPGSFTGIRIGVSAARALGQVLSVPCISVPTLETFRFNLNNLDNDDAIICPVFDARRNQVYSGAYFGDKVLVPGDAYSLSELLDRLVQAGKEIALDHKQILFFGDGINKYESNIRAWAEETNLPISFAPEEYRYQKASSVAILASKYYKEGLTVDYNELKPDYMRLAEAERKLREQKPNG